MTLYAPIEMNEGYQKTQKEEVRLKTKYQYIHFIETTETINGKPVWQCLNNKTGDILSKIFWYKPWKDWCFTQAESGVIFNDGCLLATINFIKQLKEHKK